MRYLRTNTATRITVGPFQDKTDGVTAEVALTVTGCKLTFIVDTGGVPTLIIDAAATASGGDNDMVHVTNDDAGFYDLELTAAQTNYLGRAMLAITDAATHCPVFHEFMILPAVVYDAMVLGTDVLQVDMTQIGGVAQSATDLKHFADSGYDPATSKVQGVVLVDTTTTNTDMRGTNSAALASVCTEARLANLDATISSRSSHSAADVWAVATRLLTAGTNIVLAKGTGVTGFNDIAVADIFTGQMTEAYAADGTAPTLAQMQYMIWSALSEMSISGTTITCKKLDGTTTSMTFTTDSASNPTSRTRAT